MALCFCKEKAVIDVTAPYCKAHFTRYFEKKVEDTIDTYSLLDKGEKIAVASSGGKDSTVLLHILKKLGYSVTAIAIDEGIHGYRNLSLNFLESFCAQNNIELRKFSFKNFSGENLDDAIKKFKLSPCHVCGVWRRYILNSAARTFDVMATGHNLDDEVQSIVMNMMKSNIAIMARLGPVSGKLSHQKFTRKVKPLYFCHEKEVAAYAFLNKLITKFTECPNSFDTFRSYVRDQLNLLESNQKGAKLSIVNSFLDELNNLKQMNFGEIDSCSLCSEPTKGSICNACKLLSALTAQA